MKPLEKKPTISRRAISPNATPRQAQPQQEICPPLQVNLAPINVKGTKFATLTWAAMIWAATATKSNWKKKQIHIVTIRNTVQCSSCSNVSKWERERFGQPWIIVPLQWPEFFVEVPIVLYEWVSTLWLNKFDQLDKKAPADGKHPVHQRGDTALLSEFLQWNWFD